MSRRSTISRHVVNGCMLTTPRDQQTQHGRSISETIRPGVKTSSIEKSSSASKNSDERVHCHHSPRRVALENEGLVAPASAQEPVQDPEDDGNKALGRLK